MASARAIAIFAGLLAAFWAAVGIVVRQRVAQEVPADQDQSPSTVSYLVRHPVWWAGTLAAVAGYVFQALALAHGSLLLVQPLLVSSLLFALPLSARLSHQRISGTEWGWALLLTAALAAFVLVGQPREGHNRPPIPAWTAGAAGHGAAGNRVPRRGPARRWSGTSDAAGSRGGGAARHGRRRDEDLHAPFRRRRMA